MNAYVLDKHLQQAHHFGLCKETLDFGKSANEDLRSIARLEVTSTNVDHLFLHQETRPATDCPSPALVLAIGPVP
jgi:hypothetical protein